MTEPTTSVDPDDPAVARAVGDDVSPRLWLSDTGTLPLDSRRALVALIKGPYISAERHKDAWRALLNDTDSIRSRLADLFLDLVIDADFDLAFVRAVRSDDDRIPQVVRSTPLTLVDSAMVLYLRSELLRAGSGARCFVGRDEVYDHMQLYRGATSTDVSGFTKRLNASWKKFEGFGILVRTGTEDRYEVSQVLRLIFGADEIAALRDQFATLVGGADGDGEGDDE